MGDHEGWAQPPSGLLPNGLLPNEAASVMRDLDSERWIKAEERTAELIACIQPNPPSEERRNAVADYVQRLIFKCFPCQVFTFGSVPLKTYLPDGDIDLTAFSKNQNQKDTWAHQVRDMLESEEKNENAEFHVKEVQYIQAEVKIIKCLVENIVVDISFNQLGGLCTLCFLEEVDHLINQNHLFKRSIILIKAWCYYESRILGAHHGLISTYALETLVLYIFHVFNNSFAGPLEVLYRFLEFFSKFDWDNFCVSLWGPVPITSLPDVTAEPPRKDGGELLLSKLFLEACSSVYAVFPGGLENQGQPFVSKHFNVIDPLRVNNNLGRSVSKGNFFRIRSAFAFGAKRLARLLECPKEELFFEINQFFTNTWERHGSGNRPDAPKNDLWSLRLLNSQHLGGSENSRDKPSCKRSEISSSSGSQGGGMRGSSIPTSQHSNSHMESTSRNPDVLTVARTQNQKSSSSPNNSRVSDQIRKESSSNQVAMDKNQRSPKPENLVNDIQGRFLFARTRSSPELTDASGEVSSLVRRNKVTESGKSHNSARMDTSGRKKLESDVLPFHNTRSPADDPSNVRHISSRKNLDVTGDLKVGSNNYHSESNSVVGDEEFASHMGTREMNDEEQDRVNLMASSVVHGLNGPVHVPLNLTSGHLPLPISSSVLASMGFSQRNFGGMVPTNIPLMETPWGTNLHFPQGLVPSPMSHYFPGVGLTSSSEDSIEPVDENFNPVERNSGEADNKFWHEQDSTARGFDLDNGGFEMLQSDDKQQSTSGAYDFLPSSRGGGSGSYMRVSQKSNENRASVSDGHASTFQYQDERTNEVYYDDRIATSRSPPAIRTSSTRSKTSPETPREGSSAKVSKSMKDRRGRKTTPLVAPASIHAKGKNVSEHSSAQTDDDNRDWSQLPTVGSEIDESSTGPQSVSPLHVPRHQVPGFELAQTSGSDSMLPFAPVLLGPGSQQRAMDNSGVVPIAFYPTGPPVPFVTMLPFYNFSSEAGSTDSSASLPSHFGGDEALDNSDSGQNFDSSEGHNQPDVLNTSNSLRMATSVEPSDHKADILNSDFASHWQNLQYGRFCQNRHPGPMMYPSPAAVSPVYLQGRFPWDGPGRPLSANMNLFTLSYGSRLVPVAPLQTVSNRPTSAYQHYVDEMPRYRSGTGTYLPNPKVSVRDRHSTGGRRGNYSYDRNDHHGDREGNWNINAKSRAAGRSHARGQADKPNSRLDRVAGSESRAERPWSSHRHDSLPSYQSQNGPFRAISSQSGSTSVAYGMYPLPGLNSSGVSTNGPTMPSVVMLYPYDHNAGYGTPAEQLEFGSLGPVGFSNEISQVNEGSRLNATFEDQRFHGSAPQGSSPDQPSSPHYQRGI